MNPSEQAEPRVGWKIPEWGRRYGFGRAKSYQIIREGEGPRTCKPRGGVEIVTIEADQEWRRSLAQARATRAADRTRKEGVGRSP